MALPVLSKTWEFDVNNTAATSVADEVDVDTTLLTMKDVLTNGVSFTSPWTVISSSDSSTADSSDNWIDAGDLVHNTAGNPHSWIVLEAPVGDQQVCFDLANATPERIGVYWSATAGFTGGTTTNRPTATDESEVNSPASAIMPTSTFTSKIHCLISSDGEETRLMAMSGGSCFMYIITSELDDSPSGLTDTSLFIFDGNTGAEQVDIANLRTAGYRMNDSGTVFSNISLSGEAYQTGTSSSTFDLFSAFTIANSWNSEFHIGPVGVWGTSGSQQGKAGNLPDVFWGQEVVNTGDQYPSTGTLYQFAQVGDLIFPWDSTTVIQTS